MIRRALLSALALLVAQPAAAETILFVGNSYTFGAASPVWKYRAASVTDINGDGVGGVPALFKAFADQSGLDFQVSLETAGGKDLRWHWENRRSLLDRRWDHVVLQEWSSLNKTRAGSPDYRDFAGRFATLFAAHNPKVRVHLTAIWGRPDQVYPATGAWHDTSIMVQTMMFRIEADVAASAPGIASVLPVGEAFLHAIGAGFADPNPYDGVAFGQVSLWGFDHYHGSMFGYYLEALVIFGRVTGRDPRSLGRDEVAGQELGLSRDQAERLQQIAFDTLAAER